MATPRDKTLNKMTERATSPVSEGEPIIPNGPVATTEDIQEFKNAVEQLGYTVEFGEASAVTKSAQKVVHITARCTTGELTDEFLHVWNNAGRRGQYLSEQKSSDQMRFARMPRLSGSATDRQFHQLELENYKEHLKQTGDTIPGFVWRTFSRLPEPKLPAERNETAVEGPGPGVGKVPVANNYVVRRGPAEPNPVREPRLTLYRGTAEGAGRHQHTEQDPHDFDDGLYLTDDPWLAEQYARLRAYDYERLTGKPTRPIVQKVEVTQSELQRILNLREGRAAEQWSQYLRTPIYSNGPTPEEMIRVGNRHYWTMFEEFLRQTNRNLEDYDTVIGPEFVRQGWQYCIRGNGLEKKIEGRLVEIDVTPVWVRVVDRNGDPVDVNINDPRTAEENRAYVKERLSDNQVEERTEIEPVGPPGGPIGAPVGRPGPVATGVAGILLLLELARIAIETAQAIRSMPSGVERKLEPIRRNVRFWHRFGIHAVPLILVLRDDVKALEDKPVHSKGRILRGITPKAIEKLETDDIEFFVGFVDSFGIRDEKLNPIDQSLTSLIQYMRFLNHGWQLGVDAIVPPREDVKLPLPRKHRWYVVTQRPDSPGSTTLITEYYSLELVLGRIWKKLLQQENSDIRRRKYADTPVQSPLSRRARSEFQIRTEQIYRFKASSKHSVYTVFYYEGDMTPREWASTKDWGDLTPRFYQVGSDDIGSPFFFDKAKLVTGADAETNAFLFGILAEHDEDALVAEYEPTLEPGTIGPPRSWVNVPVVYVDAKELEAAD